MGQENFYTKHSTNFSVDTGYFALVVKHKLWPEPARVS